MTKWLKSALLSDPAIALLSLAYDNTVPGWVKVGLRLRVGIIQCVNIPGNYSVC